MDDDATTKITQIRHTHEAGAESTGTAPLKDGLLDVLIDDRRDESQGVVSFVLKDPEGRMLPRWEAGSHIDIHLPSGLTRQYSLCSSPDDLSQWRIAVLRVENGRGGSREVHDALREGLMVKVSAPRNNFTLKESPRYLFLAGGIGITPLLSMRQRADRTGRDWEFLYAGRSLSSMAFLDDLSDPRVKVVPEDTAGRIDLAALLGTPRTDTLVYCCGPEPMLRAVEEAMSEWPDALQLERFTAKGEPVGANRPFTVRFSISDLEAKVSADQSILEVAESMGVPVEFSCREGTCGTCETYILSGRAEHRDSILTASEQEANESMFICVSRAAEGEEALELEL